MFKENVKYKCDVIVNDSVYNTDRKIHKLMERISPELKRIVDKLNIDLRNKLDSGSGTIILSDNVKIYEEKDMYVISRLIFS